jgi:uncharacterized Zn-binding protein involved in type VI secretion
MAGAHRKDDSRSCGATTIVSGQSTVFVETKLWAVAGDPNSHGGGALIASGSTVKINNKLVIINGDSAALDVLAHPDPASSGSGTVSCYG